MMKNKALQILLDYDVLELNETSREDFEYAKSEGYMFDNKQQIHDNAIEIAFNEFSNCSKKKITNLFLASLSTHNLDWRVGLSVFAIMQTFPRHTFESRGKGYAKTCKICGSVKQLEVDLNFINQTRYTCGGIVGHEIYDFTFHLSQQNKLADVTPTDEDFRIFNEIVTLITISSMDETPTSLQRKLRTIKGFKSNEEERRCLLDTLGFCSILETGEHKGFLKTFTDLGLSPRKSRSSDWLYPVDWWRGKDGINKDAFDFWFREYEKITSPR